MSVAELIADVEFTVDKRGQVTAVVVKPALWQRIVDALEDVEDRELVKALQARLFDGPAASGASRWLDVVDEWQ